MTNLGISRKHFFTGNIQKAPRNCPSAYPLLLSLNAVIILKPILYFLLLSDILLYISLLSASVASALRTDSFSVNVICAHLVLPFIL